jgi:hypothetical protein
MSKYDLQEDVDAARVRLKLEEIKHRGLLFQASEADEELALLKAWYQNTKWWQKMFWSSAKRNRIARLLTTTPVVERYERLEKSGFFDHHRLTQ